MKKMRRGTRSHTVAVNTMQFNRTHTSHVSRTINQDQSGKNENNTERDGERKRKENEVSNFITSAA